MQQENERSLRCKEFVANQSKRKAPLSVPSLQASSLPVSLRAQSLSQGETLGSQLDTLSHSFLSSTPTPFHLAKFISYASALVSTFQF